MFDFPASPALGQAFYAPNGPVYVWDGVTWQAQPGSAVANVLWSDTAPVAPFNGQLWGNSLTGILYSWYTDPNSSQWVAISGGAPASVKTARTRNRIVNPTCQISQENGTTAVTASLGYPADQWVVGISGITSSGQKVTLATPTPEGTVTAVVIAATVAKASLATNDLLTLTAAIEGLDVADLGWGTAQAKPVVLRFCAMADTAGTYSFALRNNTPDRAYCGSFTLATANVPQVFSFAIPGDTTGTWLTTNGIGIRVHFCHAVGSQFVGVAGWQAGAFMAPPGCINGAAIANKGLFITDVGLYSDPDNTGVAPRFEAPSYEDDLARCMRYYESGLGLMFSGNVTSGSAYYARANYRVPKRASPSVAGVSQGGASNFPAGLGTVTPNPNQCYEQRTASGTGLGMYDTVAVAVNARLI